MNPNLSPSSTPSGWFFSVLLLGTLALCAAYAALVLGQASYAEVLAMSRITYHEGGYKYLPVLVSAAEFALAQRIVIIGAGALLATSLGLLLIGQARGQLATLASETRAALTGAGRQLTALSPSQRRAAGFSLALLTLVRIYFGIVKSYHSEEVASYDFFISRGLLAVTSFYPIPNNHVLTNTLNWLFFQLNPSLWFTLRLPIFIVSTAGTVALFAGLLRFGTFRTALVALTLFAWVQLSMYNAAAGRGYWLLMTLAGGHFFAMVALLARPEAPRVAWAVLLGTGILGCFTVPSFAYVVLSAMSYLGLVFLRRRAWNGLGQTVALGLGIAGGSALLYTPLLLLSGWQRLLANGYVVSRPWSAFFPELPAFVWFTEGTLAGQRTIGAAAFGAGLIAFAWLWRARVRAALPPDLSMAVRQLGPPALWFALLPYVLLTVQRVLPPERVLLYKALYFFTLLGLLIDAWLRAHPGRWWPRLAGLGISIFVAYQTFTMYKLVMANRLYMERISRAFTWLQGQPTGRVLVSVSETALHSLYFAHTRTPHRSWQLDSSPQPGARYRYVIVEPGYQGPYRPPQPAQPAYHDATNDIYVLPAPGRPVPRDPVWEQ